MENDIHKEFVWVEFSFTDKFGQESRMKKSLTASTFGEELYPVEELLLEFKNFLTGAGFPEDEINKIKFLSDEGE